MSQALADSVRGHRVVAINNVYELAPWADALAANDLSWWRKHPEAKQFSGSKYSANRIGDGVEQVRSPLVTSCSNSGVLALEVAKRQGATRILLLGFDMHGTHYFGKYTNGCTNTTEARRKVHHSQFARWGRANRNIEVINCTEGSALACFPKARLDDFCSDVQVAHTGVSGEVHGGACEHAASDGAEALQVAAPLHLHHG